MTYLTVPVRFAQYLLYKLIFHRVQFMQYTSWRLYSYLYWLLSASLLPASPFILLYYTEAVLLPVLAPVCFSSASLSLHPLVLAGEVLPHELQHLLHKESLVFKMR
jgi:hypothetical protein